MVKIQHQSAPHHAGNSCIISSSTVLQTSWNIQRALRAKGKGAVSPLFGAFLEALSAISTIMRRREVLQTPKMTERRGETVTFIMIDIDRNKEGHSDYADTELSAANEFSI